MYSTGFDTIDTFLGISPVCDSPSDMCYLANQWIAYNRPIYLIDAHALSAKKTPYYDFPSVGFPICHVLFD